jgi:hypothetical protein
LNLLPVVDLFIRSLGLVATGIDSSARRVSGDTSAVYCAPSSTADGKDITEEIKESDDVLGAHTK